MPKSLAAKLLNKDSTKKYLLHVSGLHDTKGCEDIILCLPELVEKYSNIELIVVGGGPQRDILFNLAKENNISENVDFVGFVKHEILVNYYNLADVFVFPTKRKDDEGEANVLLESLACNKPFDTTKIPGNVQLLMHARDAGFKIIKDDFNIILIEGLGFLININSRKALLAAIDKSLDSNFRFSVTKSKKLIKQYSLDSIGKKLKDNILKI